MTRSDRQRQARELFRTIALAYILLGGGLLMREGLAVLMGFIGLYHCAWMIYRHLDAPERRRPFGRDR